MAAGKYLVAETFFGGRLVRGRRRAHAPRVSPPHSSETALAPTSHAIPVQDGRWFEDEVHSHRAQLKAYLRGSFPGVGDVEDVVQESFLRIWKARARGPIRSAKAFLFGIARHLALDQTRRNAISPVKAVDDVAGLPVPAETESAAETLSADEKFQELAAAIATLPPRCRAAFVLCKLKGISHRDAAAQLGLSERTVDEHVFRGMQRLGEELRRRRVDTHF
jgi:RNA polymerase sigma factor (sigma-70 family)